MRSVLNEDARRFRPCTSYPLASSSSGQVGAVLAGDAGHQRALHALLPRAAARCLAAHGPHRLSPGPAARCARDRCRSTPGPPPPPRAARRCCGRRTAPESAGSGQRLKSGLRNAFHSVTSTRASAPSRAAWASSHSTRSPARPVDPRRLRARLRIEGAHARAGLPQLLEQATAGCLAHVVGIGLEGKAPDRNRASRQPAGEVLPQQLEQLALLCVVDRFDRRQQARLIAVGPCRAFQRLRLWEARAAVAGPWIDEVVADARVGADAGAPVRCRR